MEKFTFDKEQIQNQVKNEVLAEEKYWQKNSAKMRAVEQRVPTYEDFRQMVLASHLKPLEKGESIRDNKNKTNTWNSLACSNNIDLNYEILLKESNLELEKQLNALINTKPKTSLEFTKIWRQIEEKHTDEIKWNFLDNLGADSIKQIFSVEINGDMLGKFITLFEKKLDELITSEDKIDKSIIIKHLDLIFNLLNCFTRCNRFKLNLMFLKDSELNSFKKIVNFFDNRSNIQNNKLIFYEVSNEFIQNLKSNYL
jgi:coiled-coil domain-containing protein 103